MSRAKKILSEGFNSIIESADSINIELLEGDLSRIYSFVSKKVPFAMITAYRGGNNHEVNQSRNAQLMSDLRSFGLGGLQLNGYYQEKGMSEPSKERAFFVPYLGDDEPAFKAFMTRMCSKYNQDAVAYSNGQEWGLIFNSGSYERKGDSYSFGPDKVKDAWSRIRGKWFVLVEGLFCSGSTVSRMAWDSVGLIPIVPFESKSLREAAKLQKKGKGK